MEETFGKRVAQERIAKEIYDMRGKEMDLRADLLQKDKEREKLEKKAQRQEREQSFKKKIDVAKRNREFEEKSLKKKMDMQERKT